MVEQKTKVEEENAKIARFISPTRELVLWIDPLLEERTPTGFKTNRESGYAIEFQDGLFQTNKPEEIETLINHSGFRNDFHPLPVAGDWWETNGWFKRDKREVLTPTQKAKIRKTEGDKVIAQQASQLAKTIPRITSE